MKNQAWKIGAAVAAAGLLSTASKAHAQAFTPGDILVSLSVYDETGAVANLQPGSALPTETKAGSGKYIQSTTNGSYGNVFKNDSTDGSFGVTAPIYIDEVNPTNGSVADSINITQEAADEGLNLVTSFSSKSELALNLSTAGNAITFMGYDASVGALDVSNSTTPGVPDSNNPDQATPTYREVAQLNANGSLEVTTTNAYSGNNGRAAVLDDTNGQDEYLTVGNAGNGGTAGTTLANGSAVPGATGVQIISPGQDATSSPPGTTQAGQYSITQQGDPADKTYKDNNFRGETVYNNTLYVTKGSGSNGIDSVYQVGSTGSLPTGTGNAINILPGFPTSLAPSTTAPGQFYPFGLFFANSTTLYVADEGDGTLADAGDDPNSGLEKLSLNTSTGQWNLDYVLQAGLGLGTQEVVGNTASADGYPDPYTDGLRNITGVVNANGTVTIYGVTSTTDPTTDTGDFGADPNEVVAITDTLADTALPTSESFNTLEDAEYQTVYRGVSFTPQATAVPEASSIWLLGFGLVPLGLLARRRA